MRLTKRDNGGNAVMACESCEIKYQESCCSLYYCRNALIGKLAVYEDAEEQGLLIRLPCKVGDTVYQVVRRSVDVTGYRMEWEWETAVEAVKFRLGMVDSVGKTIFLTREEAEAVLRIAGKNV